MANPSVVFIQGSLAKEQAFPWMFWHFHPKVEGRPAPVDLVFFDFLNGEIKRWDNWTASRGRSMPPSPTSTQPLLPQVQLRNGIGGLDPGPARSSVVGFYNWMNAQAKGSVVSLQIFSHGWRGGPLLWYSYEYDSAGVNLDENDLTHDRDPNDADFRKRDFSGRNPAAASTFKDAFAPDAFIKLWGCNFEQDHRELVQLYWKVPARGTPFNDGKRNGYLLAYLAALKKTFPMIMARALQLPVWASPTGWGSTPWDLASKYDGVFPPDLKKKNWWKVSSLFRRQDGGVKFYEQILKARVDAVDYVEYKESWLKAAEKKASMASTEPAPPGSPAGLQQRLLDRVAQLQRNLGSGDDL